MIVGGCDMPRLFFLIVSPPPGQRTDLYESGSDESVPIPTYYFVFYASSSSSARAARVIH
jgi:hypothetical protein